MKTITQNPATIFPLSFNPLAGGQFDNRKYNRFMGGLAGVGIQYVTLAKSQAGRTVPEGQTAVVLAALIPNKGKQGAAFKGRLVCFGPTFTGDDAAGAAGRWAKNRGLVETVVLEEIIVKARKAA